MQSDVYQKLLDAIEDQVQGLEGFLNITAEEIGSILLKVLQVENFTNNKEDVRQVLFDYFASHGFRAYIVIKHDREITYRLKINDYETCIYTEACIKQLPKEDNILTPSKEKPSLSELNSNIYQSIASFLNKYIKEEEDKRGLFKAILKVLLNLSQRDVIFFVDNGVLIKQFQESEANAIGTLSTTSQRVYEGLDKSFLEEINNTAIKHGIKEKIPTLIAALLKGQLNPSELDNATFSKNFTPVLQDKFLDLVPEDKRISTIEIKQAIANYLLRIYFDSCIDHIARKIIEKMINKEPKIDAFIKFYNGDVSFTPSGKRFTRPDITDKEGNRWNSSTIFQVAMQRKTGLDKIARNAEAIRLTEEAIAKFKREIISQKNFIYNNKSVIASLEAEIQKKLDISSQAKENIFELKRRLLNQRGTAAGKEIQEKINALSVQIKQLERDEQHIFAEKKRLDSELEKAKARIITYEKDQASYEYKLEKDKQQKEQLSKSQIPLEEKYSVVANALAKAISSFRGFESS